MMELEAGFLIVKTYLRLYKDYVQCYNLSKPVYAIPRTDMEPASFGIQYRGLDRDALDPYIDSNNLAEVRMEELEKEERCKDGFLFSEETVEDVFSYITDKAELEIIWTRVASSGIPTPTGFISAGYEPSFFVNDHFSASCDCMLFPRWHGSDKEGTLFKKYFKQLNHNGLFNKLDTAQSFLDFYLSFDWTETGEYEIAEVFLKESKSKQAHASEIASRR